MGEYNPEKIELDWQKRWGDGLVFNSDVDQKKPKFYCLEMFPYPSGHMHMGHVRNYSIGDSMARFKRLSGFNVLYPMGYDSFGMPAENAAKMIGGHPHDVTWANIESIRSDLNRMGFSYDWRRELATSDSTYYRWNQWIFLKFHEMGLVERRTAPVNWCDPCDTVLANEQVKNNRCWRCAGEVRQKDMAQWFLKMTEYADELLDELENIEFPENVKAMQRNWIGRSHGAEIHFPIDGNEDVIKAFTTRPDTIFGVTFVTLAPEHPLCESLVSGTEFEEGYRALADECARMSEFDRINMLKDKKGVFLGRYAENPLTGEKVPIYAGNFVVASYGTGAVMAVPGHDQRDHDFAKKYDIPILQVLSEEEGKDPKITGRAFEGLGWMINSGQPGFDGLFGDEAKSAVIQALENKGMGSGTIQYRLKDWLLSRQRFWGTPIPFIHCDDCGVIPVPEENLPIELPLDVVFTEGQSGNPLATHEGFVNTDCPNCGSAAKRETDTMDTFYDSSWYFLRFADAQNQSAPFDKINADYWMENGVDLYIGGIEHAVMHLLYARFFTKALRDIGMNSVSEPFSRLVCQGMVNAPTPFCNTCNIEYHVDKAEEDCPQCNEKLTFRSAKMSKSLGNTVSPEEMINQFGADTVRLFILFGSNPEVGMDWSDSAVEANHRQMHQIFAALDFLDIVIEKSGPMDDWLSAKGRSNFSKWWDAMDDVRIREGVMISHFDMLSDLQWAMRRGGVGRKALLEHLKKWGCMLYPATPHLAEEWNQHIGNQKMLAETTIINENLQEDDFSILAAETALRNLINNARNVKGLAERHTDSPVTKLVIQTSPSWKNELMIEAIKLFAEDFDFMREGQSFIQSHPLFQEESMRGELMQFWRSITIGSKKSRGRVFTLGEGERILVTSGFDEAKYISDSAIFISEAIEVSEIEVYPAGMGEDIAGKARFAGPLQPGLAFL
ncbi:MAG: leucine--tRNA ligase [Candidatus Thalassarchaeaceae archaeon]|nr:leucine--tRNA ligase [Candidatus Thalassarchaeaceae archaeon]